MVFFSKLNDSVKDLFSNGFKPLGSLSVKSKSTTKDGVKLQFSGKKKNGTDKVTGSVNFSQTFVKDDLKLDLSGEVNEEGTASESIVLSGFAEGVKVEVSALCKTKAETDKAPLDAETECKRTRNKIEGLVTYSNDKVGVNFGLTKKQLHPAVVDFNLAGDVSDNVSLGVSVSAPLKKVESGKILDTDFTAKLSSDDVNILCNLTDAGQKSSVAVVQNVNNKLTVGIELTNKGIALPWCFKTKEGEETTQEEVKEVETKKDWGLTLAAAYKTDSNSTFRAKLNDGGVATVSYDFELKENLRANVVAETKVSTLGEGTKLGLSLSYSN